MLCFMHFHLFRLSRKRAVDSRLSVFSSVCPSVRLPACLSVRLSVCTCQSNSKRKFKFGAQVLQGKFNPSYCLRQSQKLRNKVYSHGAKLKHYDLLNRVAVDYECDRQTDKSTKIGKRVWIYTGDILAKFHGNILSLSENNAKSFMGGYFF